MTDTANFLVELGTEELPPKALLKLSDAFARGIAIELDEARLNYTSINAYATPRRLAVAVADLQLCQPTQTIEHRGPPVRLAFDAEGNPTRAAEAFAKKCGVAITALDRQTTDKGEWLYHSGEQAGKNTADLLEAMVTKSLSKLPIPKRMRWGSNDTEFVRPVHWLVMLLDKNVVPATVLGLTADRITFGHRFMAPDSQKLNRATDYVDTLRNKGKVIVDFAERREAIVAMTDAAASQAGGIAVFDSALADEVTALVEWPVPVTGEFPQKFLRLPTEVLIATLQGHQKYFPLRADTEQQELLPAFIAISNLESKDPKRVKLGNEKVVLPRLSDAAFFWDQDTRSTLADRQVGLDAVVYQKGLGSLGDKARRVAKLAESIAPLVDADAKLTQRAAELARCDLLTDMVGEFPELQGRMGYYYALHDREPEAVAIAIEEQYLPRHASDTLPQSSIGTALSLADRLDTLAGIFALGKKPSGNKDPFALRRQALGLVRMCINNGIDFNLSELLAKAIALQPIDKQPEGLAEQLYDFILGRTKAWYLDGQAPGLETKGVSAELFNAVQSRAPASLTDLHQRLCALAGFMQLDAASSLAAANKRIANILKSADATDSNSIKEHLFADDEERKLYSALNKILAPHRSDLDARNYAGALNRLASLRAPVDSFFDNVMVMADDEQLRENRLALLNVLRGLFLDIADISALPTKT
jgi:glycyl-tRNA synthetase beta chain